MNLQPTKPEVSDQMIADHPEAPATQQFFQTWQHAVRLAGPRYFGIEHHNDINLALSKWDLCPDVPLIDTAIGAMSHGEQVFLAALVSFYNDETGGRLLQRVGVHGLADFGLLDSRRRYLIANLIIHYNGW
ncbi:hypothetical protein AO268_11485 [Pseudomonas sp. ICMP 8385]|uniref:hypothetical protein n=1 Tax=Pseudomonas sp. ICMP 8385 TaxID=1718920 RepID=UPI000C07C5B6|nr:hypothetical protein [Pseudomonas sp. ICMP 8385]PHN53592.1 hypothetical protein AO268_11485 [Pseudomonas sp. ICMP 8385]